MKPTILLLVFLIAASFSVIAQMRPVQLQLQKNGRVKKRIYTGTAIQIQNKDRFKFSGIITYMKTGELILDGRVVVPLETIRKIQLPNKKTRKPINWEELGWVTFGVALSTTGMALSKWETWPAAAAISAVLGYSPYLIQKIKRLSFKKYKYRMGGRFRLRVWDLNYLDQLNINFTGKQSSQRRRKGRRALRMSAWRPLRLPAGRQGS